MHNHAITLVVSISIIAGCADLETEVAKDEIREVAKADANDLCATVGASQGCDLCEELDYYGDGECDLFCETADIDCEIVNDPFDSGACHGESQGFSDLALWFSNPTQAWVHLADYNIETRWRYCQPVGGCTEWAYDVDLLHFKTGSDDVDPNMLMGTLSLKNEGDRISIWLLAEDCPNANEAGSECGSVGGLNPQHDNTSDLSCYGYRAGCGSSLHQRRMYLPGPTEPSLDLHGKVTANCAQFIKRYHWGHSSYYEFEAATLSRY